MSNLDLIRGRSTVLTLTNQTGATRSPGDIVALSTANDESFIVSSTSNYSTTQLGVVDETIGIASNGRVVVEGYARNVKVTAAVSRGDYLFHSTTQATAVGAGFASIGTFGQVLKAGSGTGPSAAIFPTSQVGPSVASAISIGSNSTDVSGTSSLGGLTTYAPSTHLHRGVTSLSHTSNTYYGNITLIPQGQVGITSPVSGTFAFNVSGAVGGSSGSSVTGSMNQLSGDVAMTTANTYYTGPSLTLAAGTYVLTGVVTIDNQSAGGGRVTIKLWDGTTVGASSQMSSAATTTVTTHAVTAYVVLSGTATWKISCAANGNTFTILAAANTNGAGNNASTLVALKIA